MEATPFLLLGIVVSAFVHVFVSEDRLLRLVPKNPILSLVPALFLGMLMPVCECGNVAVARRFLAKGVPISTCIAFLLAAPILNPVAIFATATAFRFRPEMVWLRGGLAFVIAASVGLLVGHLGRGEELLAGGLAKRRGHEHPPPDGHIHQHGHDHSHQHGHGGVLAKVGEVFSQVAGEFMGMMQVLLIGAAVADPTRAVAEPIAAAALIRVAAQSLPRVSGRTSFSASPCCSPPSSRPVHYKHSPPTSEACRLPGSRLSRVRTPSTA